MCDLDEALARLAANALRGRVRRDEPGMRGFKALEFLHQLIEVGVGELGGVEDIVEMLVAADLVAQLVDLPPCGPGFIFGDGGHGCDYIVCFAHMLESHCIEAGGCMEHRAEIMKRVFLIYNPASGRRREKRTHDMARVVAVFRAAGVQVEASATTHPGSAILQARQAAEAGFDTVVACGGDGTANEALNGLMQASREAALGLVPLGSGNLLASDLGLPSNPEAAAQKLLTYEPRAFRPGTVSSTSQGKTQKRHFIVAAGVGADAELMYRTAVEAKERWGRNAYFLEMARMALHGSYPMFDVEWEDEQGTRKKDRAMLAMAIRAGSFPGLLSLVDLGTSLLRDDFCLLLFRTDKVRRFLSYFAGVATGMNWKVRDVDAVHSKWFRCSAATDTPQIHSQADGELLGALPAELSVEPRSLKMLMEPARKS